MCPAHWGRSSNAWCLPRRECCTQRCRPGLNSELLHRGHVDQSLEMATAREQLALILTRRGTGGRRTSSAKPYSITPVRPIRWSRTCLGSAVYRLAKDASTGPGPANQDKPNWYLSPNTPVAAIAQVHGPQRLSDVVDLGKCLNPPALGEVYLFSHTVHGQMNFMVHTYVHLDNNCD
jgi:hypothetical protein